MSLLKPSPVTAWFEDTFERPTPAQKRAWPLIEAGRNVLLIAPTGTGKTLAAFLGVLNELALQHASNRLPDTIRAIYVSPLRALGYDLEKNLLQPLARIYGPDGPIRVGLRTGDTSANERQQQLKRPPHILLTTPESLSVLLTQPKWLSKLEHVRWFIADEIHALAESKRGTHLAISLERLEHTITRGGGQESAARRLQRIGLSATVAPAGEVAQFLVGTGRACEIVDVSTSKRIDLRVYSPLRADPYPPAGYTGVRLIRELARLVSTHRTTLVFTNTRSGAEAATFWLRQTAPKLGDEIECHHGSLDRDIRQEVEDRLKRGQLRAVVCSTSLELGIDIGSIDLVVMLSTPKGVSRALQRTGRAGHNIRAVSRGLLMATNMNDLVECCATALLARGRELDAVRLPQGALDVLAQHLASLGCTGRWSRKDALELVRRAYPYRDLPESEFSRVLDYLAGGGRALRQQYSELFGKIELDDVGFETREGRIRRDLLQNLGVIPNEGMVAVKRRGRTLGMVEELFIRQLQPGDVFTIGGRPVRLERVGMMECRVSPADDALPTVPRWNANKMPLSNRVAEEIAHFREEIRRKLEWQATAHPPVEALAGWISTRLKCGPANARIIARMYAAQHRLSEIPTAGAVLVEEYLAGPAELERIARNGQRRGGRRRQRLGNRAACHYFFHALAGRAASDALSRVVALRMSRLHGGNAVATPDDYGFVLTVHPEQRLKEEELAGLLSPEGFREDLQAALARSDLLKYYFRNAAQIGLMVYRNYFGEHKSVRKTQWSSEVIFNVLQGHEPDHVLLRQAWSDTLRSHLDVDRAEQLLRTARASPIRLRQVDRIPPLSFALFATRIKEALLVEDPRETTERLFHLWWSKIEGKVPPGHE